jgi:hypothetical protein
MNCKYYRATLKTIHCVPTEIRVKQIRSDGLQGNIAIVKNSYLFYFNYKRGLEQKLGL